MKLQEIKTWFYHILVAFFAICMFIFLLIWPMIWLDSFFLKMLIYVLYLSLIVGTFMYVTINN